MNKKINKKMFLYLTIGVSIFSSYSAFGMQNNTFGYSYNKSEFHSETILAQLEQKTTLGNVDLVNKSEQELTKILNSIALAGLSYPKGQKVYDFLSQNTEIALKHKKQMKFINNYYNYSPLKVKPRKIEKPNTCHNLIQKMNIENLKASKNSVKIWFNTKDLDGQNMRLKELEEQICSLKHATKLVNRNIKIQDSNDSIDKLKSIKDVVLGMQKEKHPELCLFSECHCKKHVNRSARAVFEGDLMDKSKHIHNISYLGFASGDLFSDLRMLTMKIKIKNDKVKTVHLLDTDYDQAIQILRAAKTMNKNSCSDITIDNIYTLVIDYNQLQKIKVFARIVQFAQFIKLLSEFQGKKIELFIHKDAESYLNVCNNKECRKANIITAMDYNTVTMFWGKGANPYFEKPIKVINIDKILDTIYKNALENSGCIGTMLANGKKTFRQKN